MLQLEHSIDIVLSDRPVEDNPQDGVIVPLIAQESLVVSRGLSQHLDIIYKGVLKHSDHHKALLVVYDFISDDVDKFRHQSYNLSAALAEKEQLSESRAYASAAIAYLLNGSRSHKTGVWLRGEAREKRLTETFHRTMASDNLTFFELSDWGRKQAIRNTIYWRQQLEKIRNGKYAAQLKQAIDESDHSRIEV